MKSTTRQTFDFTQELTVSSPITAPKSAELQSAEGDYDIAAYDEAKSVDDGYRISSYELRKKYGI